MVDSEAVVIYAGESLVLMVLVETLMDSLERVVQRLEKVEMSFCCLILLSA